MFLLTYFMQLVSLDTPWFSDVFRGYRKRPVASNWLMSLLLIVVTFNQI